MNKTTDANLRDIHAGRTGDADSLFLKKYCVAVGWTKMGKLSALKPDRDAFRPRVAEVYPDAKPGAIPNNAGQLFRFVHEMKPGDLVVCPSKHDRQIHLGWVEGDYRCTPLPLVCFVGRRRGDTGGAGVERVRILRGERYAVRR